MSKTLKNGARKRFDFSRIETAIPLQLPLGDAEVAALEVLHPAVEMDQE